MNDKILVSDYVGNTPLVKIENFNFENVNLFAKLEGFNPTGSVKDRAASLVIKGLLDKGEINLDTTIIESSSGNFGIALANYCHKFGLKFICVVDPKILGVNEMLIRNAGAKMVKVTKSDTAGGYLLSRIETVKELKTRIKNSYWINQYENTYNANAYYKSLGQEVCDEINIDYIFMGVSSGSTITGVSRCVKDRYPNAKVIAVDVDGSVIFGKEAYPRAIPGIGSSIVPDILKKAKIDQVITVSENSSVDMCQRLLKQEGIFAGGSSGSVYAAINQYFKENNCNKSSNVVAIFADRGDRYCNTIYQKEWCEKHIFNYHNVKE